MPDLTVKEVARDLGVSVSWLYQRCAAGEITHQRYGTRKQSSIRFTPAQVVAIRDQFCQAVIPVSQLAKRLNAVTRRAS